ncbi:MAG: hypothetical protein Q4D38_11230 [Planctomycetia bacterium]|nr:hypothetical protein [Planctomycetia bacterium]
MFLRLICCVVLALQVASVSAQDAGGDGLNEELIFDSEPILPGLEDFDENPARESDPPEIILPGLDEEELPPLEETPTQEPTQNPAESSAEGADDFELPGLEDFPDVESGAGQESGAEQSPEADLVPVEREKVEETNNLNDETNVEVEPDENALPGLSLDEPSLDEPSEKPAPPKPEYSPEDRARQSRILETLKIYEQIGMASDENSPAEIIAFIVPFGCDWDIYFGSREENEKLNAIAALCWGVPMRGELAFLRRDDRLVPRIGHGIQQYNGQLLAALAIARVRKDYCFPGAGAALGRETTAEDIEERKRARKAFNVQNLVAFEQQNCRAGRDLSQTLIGLSYYLSFSDVWLNSDKEPWNLEKILYYELQRPMQAGDPSGTNQLLGLIYAVRCWKMRNAGAPTQGEFLRAERYLEKFREFAYSIQNSEGCWHPKFFLQKGSDPKNPLGMLVAGGHILRWLVAATPMEELDDPRLSRAVDAVERMLREHLTQWDPSSASQREIEGVAAALHALEVFEKRRFKD